MKRTELLKKIRKQARARGVEYVEYELSRHTGITVGGISTTVPRHSEIQDRMAEVICRQLEGSLGEGWWRK